MTDPYAIEIPDSPGVIQVVMTAGHAEQYQRWLRIGGLHLFHIPNGDPDDLATYAIGIRDGILGPGKDDYLPT